MKLPMTAETKGNRPKQVKAVGRIQLSNSETRAYGEKKEVKVQE